MKIPGLRYDSPCRFSPSQRVRLAVVPPLLAAALKAIALTCRLSHAPPPGRSLPNLATPRGIVGTWHETCALAPHFYPSGPVQTLTSYSFDGELAARVMRRFGVDSLRGSSSRGGIDALDQLEAALEHVAYVCLTLDGPRGPRRRSKPGAAILSARTGLPIVPAAFAATPCWRLRSWDRFIVPKPFGRMVCAFGVPIPPPPDSSRAAIDAKCREVDAALNALHATLEDGGADGR